MAAMHWYGCSIAPCLTRSLVSEEFWKRRGRRETHVMRDGSRFARERATAPAEIEFSESRGVKRCPKRKWQVAKGQDMEECHHGDISRALEIISR